MFQNQNSFQQQTPFGQSTQAQQFTPPPGAQLMPMQDSSGVISGLVKGYLGGEVLGAAGDVLGGTGAGLSGTGAVDAVANPPPSVVNDVTKATDVATNQNSIADYAQSAGATFFDYAADSNSKLGLMRDAADSFGEGYSANSAGGVGSGLMGGFQNMGQDAYGQMQQAGQNLMKKGDYYTNKLQGLWGQ